MTQKVILLSFYLMLGFIFQFPSVAMRFWLIETVNMSPAQMMAMSGLVGIPWCLKPIYGFISDSCPIFGYKRKPYILFGCFVATSSYWLLPWCAFSYDLVCLMCFSSSLGLCIADVVCDSILVTYARQEKEENTGSIQSWCWGLRAVGGLFASMTGGVAYDSLGPQLVQIINGTFPLVISFLFLFIDEPHVESPTNPSNTVRVLCTAFKNPNIWKPGLFLFIIAVTPGFGGVTSYYFEHNLKFSATEFTILDTTSYVTSIVGTIIYKKYLSRIKFRKIFFWTLTLSWLLKWSYLSIVSGFNESIGISNLVVAMADSVILSLLGQFLLLPTVILAAKICPDGVEGSLYATLMSISNLGGVVSSEWGSVFANMYGVDKSHFENFSKLIILCNLIDLFPIASIALVKEPTINTEPSS